MINISEQVKALRDFEGIEQSELAQRSGVSRQHIRYIEKGMREPTFRVAQNILKALGFKLQIVRDK